MSFTVIKAGLLDTVQDQGRFGYAAEGINPSGVMDHFAAAAANALVGNSRSDAVIEIHYPGLQLLFREPTLIAICGGSFGPVVVDEPIPEWQPVMVKRNACLQFTKWQWGARVYIAVHGGLDIEKWLGSYSTHSKAGAGGYKGRQLAKNDVIFIRKNAPEIRKSLIEKKHTHVLTWGISDRRMYSDQHPVLVVPGPEWDLLESTSKSAFLSGKFFIDQRSDRMGYLLNGPRIQMNEQVNMISSGVTKGTIQLLPGGQLMVLMADHQTTGGYPRIANVITAHLPRLAQSSTGNAIEFALTTVSAAEQLLFSQLQTMAIIEHSCSDNLYRELYARH